MKYKINKINDLSLDGSDLWFVDQASNSIMKYSMMKKAVEYIELLPFKFEVEKIVKLNNLIYLIPIYDNDIYYYDIDKKKFMSLGIDFEQFEGIPKRKIIEVVVKDKYIYCVNSFPKFIIRIDSTTQEIRIFNVNSWEKNLGLGRVFFKLEVVENKIIFSYAKNIIVSFDMETQKYDMINVKNLDLKYIDTEKQVYDYIYSLVNVKNNILFGGNSTGSIYEFVKSDEVKEVEEFNTFFYSDIRLKACKKNFWDIIYANECLWIILIYNSNVVKYNIASKEFTCLENPLEENYNGSIVYNITKKLDDDKIFINSYQTKNAYILHTKQERIEKIDLELMLDRNDPNCKFLVNNVLMKNKVFVVDDIKMLLEIIHTDVIEDEFV